MDRAVLDAYGWTELKPTCEFLLDYEEDEDEDESGGGRRRKEALALPLARRLPRRSPGPPAGTQPPAAEEERLSGAAAEAGRGKATKKSTGRRKTAAKDLDQAEFFES